MEPSFVCFIPLHAQIIGAISLAEAKFSLFII